MTDGLTRYRRLERNLWLTRWRHEGGESPQEDAILDEMEQCWMSLGDDERSLLSQEGPRCWPMEPCSQPPDILDAPPVSAPRPWPYEGFTSPQETILSKDAA